MQASDKKQCLEEFQNAVDKVMENGRTIQGIGTLGEKTLHAVLKHYLVPWEEYHEKRCEGYVADILLEGEIIEIQTANFNVLRKKLEAFLPKYQVTIVYPIPYQRWILWIDEETGEISKKRKSPKKGTFYQAFFELYKIKPYLNNKNLHFRFFLIDIEEYRLLNGWSQDKKKGSTRYERIPKMLEEELRINTPEEFAYFLPLSLPTPFTSADYAKATKLNKNQAGKALLILTFLECVNRIGKKGNSILYEKKSSIETNHIT